jgi:hypothetical protein
LREPGTAKVASQAFAAIADAFLDWVQANLSARTFEWYQYRLERFCQRYPDLDVADLRPFHVQQRVDSYLTVAILMGHNDPSTLSRVYQHFAHNPEH